MPPSAPLIFRASRRLEFYASKLPDEVRLDPSNPKWIQLCTAGSYVYKGRPVNVTVEKFDQMAANFRAHPAYKADARALLGRHADELAALVPAKYGVVALNFDHQPAPRPGQGWFLDVERRGETFWGLCYQLPRAHEAMLSGRYAWCSIEWTDNTTLPTGEEVGAYLSGVAWTNDPFIQGMQPIQLAAPGGAMAFAWSVATDLLEQVRRILAPIEAAGVGPVLGAIAKLRAMCLGALPAPKGVDPYAMEDELRAALNLPTLSDSASIFGELDKLLGALAEEQQQEIATMPTEPTPAAKPSELHRIAFERLVKIDPGLRPDDDARIVIGLTRHFDRADDVLMAVGALQEMLGVKSLDEMTGKLTEVMSAAAGATEAKAKLAALLPDVEAANAAEEKAEGEMAQADVGAVMSRYGNLPPEQAAAIREALMLQRCGGDRECGRYKRDASGAFIFGRDNKREENSLAERRALRAGWRKTFLEKHQIGFGPQVQTERVPNYFSGPGAQFGLGEIPTTPPGYSFGNGQGGMPTPVNPNAWTWQRVASLRPPMLFGRQMSADPASLILGELARVHHDGKPTRAQFDALGADAAQILAGLGPQPPNLFARAA